MLILLILQCRFSFSCPLHFAYSSSVTGYQNCSLACLGSPSFCQGHHSPTPQIAALVSQQILQLLTLPTNSLFPARRCFEYVNLVNLFFSWELTNRLSLTYSENQNPSNVYEASNEIFPGSLHPSHSSTAHPVQMAALISSVPPSLQ